MKPKVFPRRTVVAISLVATFVLVCGASQSAWAADITQVTSNAANTSGFNSGTGWPGTVAPTSGNNYFTSTLLRTPQAAGAFSFAGDSLTLNAGGTLFIKSSSGTSTTNIITVSNLILNGGSTQLAFGVNDTVSVTLAGAITVTANSSLSAQGNASNNSGSYEALVITAPISGAAGTTITIAGGTANTGLVRFSAANTYSGTVTVATPTNGFVASGVNKLFQLNNLNAVQNATLNLVSVANGLTFSSASNTGVYNIGALSGTSNQVLIDTASAAVAVNVGSNNANTSYSGVLSGAGSFAKSGTGTLTLTGASSFSGVTTVNAGMLNTNTLAAVNTNSGIGRGSVAGSASDLVFGGGTLQYNTAAVATTDRLFTIGSASGLTATLDSSSASSTNTMSFTGTGALALGGSGARTLNFTGSNIGNNTFAPIIGDGDGGATAVTKNGAGTWSLSGTSTYTGATTVSAGTLLVNGSLGDTAVSVTGGTFGGTGAIAGSITVGTATFAPGASPGSFEAGGNLTLGSGTTTEIELGGTAFTLNGTEEYDRTKLTGSTPTLTLGGTLAVSFFGGFTLDDDQAFGIFQLGSDATLTGVFAGLGEDSVVGTFGGKDLYITYQGDFGDTGPVATFGGNDIVLYSIPEPRAAALGALGLLMLLRRRQR